MTIEPLSIDERLAVDKFEVDENCAHILLTDDIDLVEFEKLRICCPAGLYRIDEEGKFAFDYAGCLECGTCRILCGDTIIKEWTYPKFGAGVSYRFG